MRQLVFAALLLMIAPFLMGTSCNKTTDCKKVMCTMMFVSVTVTVQNSEGAPVRLDETYTLRIENNEKIRLEPQMEEGRYNVLDDSYQKKMANRTEQFMFVGIKDGKKVVEEPFTISADCCHVQKQSGKEKVVMN
ncbi:MAG TPA: hypothetical protein PL009_12930 [Flavipsychrobacter sp.]|nr:hypothetical protein [Flavipsychrobacter sp.]